MQLSNVVVVRRTLRGIPHPTNTVGSCGNPVFGANQLFLSRSGGNCFFSLARADAWIQAAKTSARALWSRSEAEGRESSLDSFTIMDASMVVVESTSGNMDENPFYAKVQD